MTNSRIAKDFLGVLIEVCLGIFFIGTVAATGLSLGMLGYAVGWLKKSMDRDSVSMCLCVATALVFLLVVGLTKLVGGKVAPCTGAEYKNPWKHVRELLFVLSNPLLMALALCAIGIAHHGVSSHLVLSSLLAVVVEVCRIRSKAGRLLESERRLAIVFALTSICFYASFWLVLQ